MSGKGLAAPWENVLSNIAPILQEFLQLLWFYISFIPSVLLFVKASSVAARLDRIDLKILRLLQNSGRLSNAELAETVAISPATCHRRTQRLFEDGFIAAVRAMVAPKKVCLLYTSDAADE